MSGNMPPVVDRLSGQMEINNLVGEWVMNKLVGVVQVFAANGS